MKYDNLTLDELHSFAKAYRDDINSLKHCLDVMPKDTYLGILCIKSCIKSKTKKLNEVLTMIARKESEIKKNQ